MAMWGSRKKNPDPATKGGRGSNQYMLKPQSGDYDAGLDASRSEVIRSILDMSHRSASSKNSNTITESMHEMSDALGDGDQKKALAAESHLRSSLPDTIGSRVTSSVRADHEVTKPNDADDRIRHSITSDKVSAKDLADDISSSKHSIADSDLTDEEDADMELTSSIESKLVKFDSGNTYGEMNSLSLSVNELSTRRLQSIGF